VQHREGERRPDVVGEHHRLEQQPREEDDGERAEDDGRLDAAPDGHGRRDRRDEGTDPKRRRHEGRVGPGDPERHVAGAGERPRFEQGAARVAPIERQDHRRQRRGDNGRREHGPAACFPRRDRDQHR